jgi:CPA2 family monovalent cation:H+ antiporter-2
VVLVGYGRVGRIVSSGLRERQVPVLLVEETRPVAAQAREADFETIQGNAANHDVIAAANLAAARCLIVAIPDAFEGGQIVAQARKINPALPIMARSHSEEETEHLKKHGANKVIMGEHEIALAMLADLP